MIIINELIIPHRFIPHRCFMSHRNIRNNRKMFLVDVCPVQDFFILLHIKRMKVLFSRSVLKVSFHKHFEKGNDTSTRNIAVHSIIR